MRLEITNLTGFTLVTAAKGSLPSVSIDAKPVTLDREAWDHTVLCAPSFGRMVERGEILVRELDAPIPVIASAPVVETTTVAEPEPQPAIESAPVVEPPRQSGGGKRKR